jgi:hypothetical protein
MKLLEQHITKTYIQNAYGTYGAILWPSRKEEVGGKGSISTKSKEISISSLKWLK